SNRTTHLQKLLLRTPSEPTDAEPFFFRDSCTGREADNAGTVDRAGHGGIVSTPQLHVLRRNADE
ncbi:hypothetical protein, partial [Arachnia propionica]|uniref:hypothetical protein n=1 Tax=Arachnia propionica TaxID=1750 RepID=UPI0028CFDEBB